MCTNSVAYKCLHTKVVSEGCLRKWVPRLPIQCLACTLWCGRVALYAVCACVHGLLSPSGGHPDRLPGAGAAASCSGVPAGPNCRTSSKQATCPLAMVCSSPCSHPAWAAAVVVATHSSAALCCVQCVVYPALLLFAACHCVVPTPGRAEEAARGGIGCPGCSGGSRGCSGSSPASAGRSTPNGIHRGKILVCLVCLCGCMDAYA